MSEIVSLGPQLADRVIRIFAGVLHAELPTASIQVRSSILTPEAEQAIALTQPDARAFWRFESWSNLEKVLRKSTLAVHAEIDSPWVSVAAAYHSSKTFSKEERTLSFQSYLTIRTQVDSMTRVIEEEDLQPEIRGWLEQLRAIATSSNPDLQAAARIRAEFHRKYGTGYVRRIERGGAMGLRTDKTFSTTELARKEGLDVTLDSLLGSAKVSTTDQTKIIHEQLGMVSTGWAVGGDLLSSQLAIPVDQTLSAAASAQGDADKSEEDTETAVDWRASLATKSAAISAEIEPYHAIPALELFGGHRLTTGGRRLFSIPTGRGPRAHDHVAVVEGDTGLGGTTKALVPVMTPYGSVSIDAKELVLTLRWQRDRGLADDTTSALHRAWRGYGNGDLPPFPREAPMLVFLGRGSGLAADAVFEWLVPVGNPTNVGEAMSEGELVVGFRAPEFALREIERRLRNGGVRCEIAVPLAGFIVEASSATIKIDGTDIVGADPETRFTGSDAFECASKDTWQEYPQKLYAGQSVRITSTGKITLTAKSDAASAYGKKVGPEGTPAARYHEPTAHPLMHGAALTRALQWNRDHNIMEMSLSDLKAKRPTPQHGCLIGRLRPADGGPPGKPFLIGKDAQRPITQDGFLQVCVNDKHYVNNSESFALTIAISG